MKANQTKLPDWLWKLIGWWRLWWHFCPACNSDAPEVDKCQVCEGYRTSRDGYPPSVETKARWWRRFLMSRCTHGVPMESQCAECSAWLHKHINTPKGNPRRG